MTFSSENSTQKFHIVSPDQKDEGFLELFITSKRLLLRKILSEDAASIVNLAGDFDIADMMNGAIPHPYSMNDAQVWVGKHQYDSIKSMAPSWAILEKNKKIFIGSIQLRKLESGEGARLSYWIGKDYWGKGYASEAVKVICEFASNYMNLKYIQAEHFKRNPKSGSILIKNGFTISDDLKSAFKDFTCGGHKLRLTIPLPSDKSQFSRITENYNNKLDRMGDAALAAGLGKKATAIGFDEDAQGQLVGVHRYKGKKVTVLNQEYFQKETNKSKLEKNNKLFESVKNIFERKDVPPSTGDNPKTAQTPPKATDDQTNKKDELEAKPKKKTQANTEADIKEDVKTEDKPEDVNLKIG